MKPPLITLHCVFLAVLLVTSCNKSSNSISQADADSLEQKIDTLTARLAELESNRDNLRAFTRELSDYNRSYTQDAITYYERKKFLADNPETALCILNIRNIHQAVRSTQNINAYKIGARIDWTQIFESKYFPNKRPTCPLGDDYLLSETYPKGGTPAATCPHGETHKHRPEDASGW